MRQQTLYPCIHAIAILHSKGQYHKVFSYIDDSDTTQKLWEIIPDIDENFKAILEPSFEEEAPEPSRRNSLKVVKGAKQRKEKRQLSFGEYKKSPRKRKGKSTSNANKPKRPRMISKTTRNVAIRHQPKRKGKKM